MGESNLTIAKRVIKNNICYALYGIYDTRNTVCDTMHTLFNSNGLQVDICFHWGYFEVFGLSENEFDELAAYYNQVKGEYNDRR